LYAKKWTTSAIIKTPVPSHLTYGFYLISPQSHGKELAGHEGVMIVSKKSFLRDRLFQFG
jgi:hypothetical protein